MQSSKRQVSVLSETKQDDSSALLKYSQDVTQSQLLVQTMR